MGLVDASRVNIAVEQLLLAALLMQQCLPV